MNRIDELIEAFLIMKSKEQMLNFMKGILTPKELEELSQRLKIVKLLKKGIPQHEIAAKLGVGVATITRGSRELKIGRFKNI
mgnify:CR=1 FL=1